MILADHEIRALGIVEPYSPMDYRPGVLSYGLSSMGYDARLDVGFKRPHGGDSGTNVLDPKAPNARHWIDFVREKRFALAPGELLLGATVEWFNMPPDVLAICTGKSSYARNGLHVLVTPLEPGWRGQVTLELVNVGRQPVMIYPGEGVAQFLFFRGARPEVNYAEKGGRYQDQCGVQVSRS